VHYSIGIVYAKQEKYKEAEDSLKKAIDIDSKYVEAYNILGIVYATKKDIGRQKRY